MTLYPKRLIEVDLPIKKISKHARREKSIRHGHISTLHIWWARRPLAACRAVLCASLWPDPADPLCPEEFRTKAAEIMRGFWDPMGVGNMNFDDPMELRKVLLDFIGDFADWDNFSKVEFLRTSKDLTLFAHNTLTSSHNSRPLIVDSFAGGGSFPLESLRVGADTFASDLNPISVLLNKIIVEFIPKYGDKLADEVNKWGTWLKNEAEKELSDFYPVDSDGGYPIAYLWARNVDCEGPGCGTKIPLLKSLIISKKTNIVGLKLTHNREKKCIDFDVIENINISDFGEGTVKRGSATCPICGFTTPVASVRKQLKSKKGGASDAYLFCVVTTRPNKTGRFYRPPSKIDYDAIGKASEELQNRLANHKGKLSLVPNEPTPKGGGSGAGRAFSQRNYGMDKFEDIFIVANQTFITY